MDLSRREMLTVTAGLAAVREPRTREPRTREPGTPEPRTQEPATSEPATSLPDTFPRQLAEMVQEMVIVSHGNAKRVRELVEAHPALARAAMDWGFGDWEDALGAASHVGNREIAEYLIGKGARPTVFSAAMLGQLEIVKAFITAHAGAQRISGPHSISLLSHAKAGGAAAAAVYEYLDRLGDAGGPVTSPVSDEELKALVGTYLAAGMQRAPITISADKGTLAFKTPGLPFARPLYHVGERVFFPAGASAVRVRFAVSADRVRLSIHDPELVLSADRS